MDCSSALMMSHLVSAQSVKLDIFYIWSGKNTEKPYKLHLLIKSACCQYSIEELIVLIVMREHIVFHNQTNLKNNLSINLNLKFISLSNNYNVYMTQNVNLKCIT